MKHSRNLYIGPGGRRCTCCFPAPGSKMRKMEYRRAKKLDKKAAFKAEEINGATHGLQIEKLGM